MEGKRVHTSRGTGGPLLSNLPPGPRAGLAGDAVVGFGGTGTHVPEVPSPAVGGVVVSTRGEASPTGASV